MKVALRQMKGCLEKRDCQNGVTRLFCLLCCRTGMCGKQMCRYSKHSICPAALCITLVHKQWRVFEARNCPATQNVISKLNYKFTLNPAIDYAFCCA
jgi:hypothetical protein